MAIQTTTKQYVADFNAFQKGAGAKAPAWLHRMRTAAFSRFVEMGFPTTHEEDWKYTNVEALANAEFAMPHEPSSAKIEGHHVDVFKNKDWINLVFVNGTYIPGLSWSKGLPKGVKIGSLNQAISSSDSTEIERHLGQFANHSKSAFTALNTAFVKDGAFVMIPDGVNIDQPVHLIFISASIEKDVVSFPRALILVGESAGVNVVESLLSFSMRPNFSNAVTEISVGANSTVHYCKMERENDKSFHVGHLQAYLAKDSTLSSFLLSEGGKLTRNSIEISLDEEGSKATLDGLCLLADHQHVDNHTFVDHRKSHTSSDQLYKGILDAESRSVFTGKVMVRKDAQKTDAHQMNKSLLLSDKAEVDSKPQLEIFADDVKCTHGAAVGPINPEEMFYLNSRGLSADAARAILTVGFASEVVSRVQVPGVREMVQAFMASQLKVSYGAEVK